MEMEQNREVMVKKIKYPKCMIFANTNYFATNAHVSHTRPYFVILLTDLYLDDRGACKTKCEDKEGNGGACAYGGE